MKHYYFKYLINNKGIDIWLKKHQNEIDLSIYYGTWKKEDYPNNIGKQHHLSIEQIHRFFELKKENKLIYFWVFYNEFIYCFKGIDLEVYNGPSEYINFKEKENKIVESLPKSIKAELFECIKKIEHPEFFSNINSNQSYNRMTLIELKNSAKEYANALVLRKPLTIDLNNYYEYLSPTQFETLIFLIFTNENSLCSSFRGSTLKDYDLRIFLKNEFYGISSGNHWLQVKLKTFEKSTINGYTIHTGKTDFDNKIIGIDWITERIKERDDILRWLNECIFNYEMIERKIYGA